MKTTIKYRSFLLVLSASLLMIGGVSRLKAQTIDIGPNQYAFQFTGNNNFGLFFNSTDSQYEFRNGSAAPVFAFDAQSGRMSTNLQFDNNSDFLVSPNNYAFRSALSPSVGLYSTFSRIQFLNSSAEPIFSINVSDGRFDTDLTFMDGKSLRVAPGTFAMRSTALPNAGLAFGTDGYEFRGASGSTDVFIDAGTGDMGVGTTTPTAKLSVDGTANFSGKVAIGSSAPLPGSFFFEAASPVGSTLRVFNFSGGLVGGWSNAAGNSGARVRYSGLADQQVFWDLGQSADNNFTLTGSGQQALWVTPTGETGLGTNAPTARLDVAGEARVRELPLNNALEEVVVVDADGNLRKRDAGTLGGGGGSSLWSQNGSVAYYNEGRVGIGTNDPNALLQISSGDSQNLLNLTNTTGGTAYQEIYSGTTGHLTLGLVGGGNGEQEGQAIFWNRKNARLVFGTNDLDRMTIRANGNVGIGTQVPGTKLDVNGSMRSSNLTVGNDLKFMTNSNRPIEFIKPGLSTGGAFIYADFWASSSEFNFIEFRRGSTGMKFRVTQGGNVWAAGKITTREVEVTLASFPDYVFRPGYDLMSLSEVDQFIQANGHLPNMPTEAEVVENGLNLGDINVKLVEKMEELTLHLIEKDKEVKAMEARLKALEQMITSSSDK